LVEQCPFKAWVAGSSPAALTIEMVSRNAPPSEGHFFCLHKVYRSHGDQDDLELRRQSLVSQGYHGIHVGGAAGGDVAGKERSCDQNKYHGCDRQRIGGCDAKEQRLQGTCE
jgi:hypothetical protein